MPDIPIKRQFKLVATAIPGAVGGFSWSDEFNRQMNTDFLPQNRLYGSEDYQTVVLDWISKNIEPGNFVELKAFDMGGYRWQWHAIHWVEDTP